MKFSNEEKNIAIFGATGHIAKNLIYQFSKNTEHNLFLFSRNQTKLKKFTSSINANKNIDYRTYDDLYSQSFDVIINCIGISDPFEISKYGNELLTLSERYDDLIIDYLKKNHFCQYLNFSSGVIYGNFSQPPNDETMPNMSENSITDSDYTLSKIRSEAKHRLIPSLKIIDI